jgi:hypothetical protein
MKLTRGEFCQFNLDTRFKLLKEFGRNILKKKVKMKLVSVYKISDFYVEVYQDQVSRRLEKVEPVKNIQILEVYHGL